MCLCISAGIVKITDWVLLTIKNWKWNWLKVWEPSKNIWSTAEQGVINKSSCRAVKFLKSGRWIAGLRCCSCERRTTENKHTGGKSPERKQQMKCSPTPLHSRLATQSSHRDFSAKLTWIEAEGKGMDRRWRVGKWLKILQAHRRQSKERNPWPI